MKSSLNTVILKIIVTVGLKDSFYTTASEQGMSGSELIRILMRREIERHKRSQRQETKQ